MSDTPRTDAALHEHDYSEDGHYVDPDFARTLERELATTSARLAEAERLLRIFYHESMFTHDGNEEFAAVRAFFHPKQP